MEQATVPKLPPRHSQSQPFEAEWLAEKMSPPIHALVARYRRKEIGEQYNPTVDEVFLKWREEKEALINPKPAPKHRVITEDR